LVFFFGREKRGGGTTYHVKKENKNTSRQARASEFFMHFVILKEINNDKGG